MSLHDEALLKGEKDSMVVAKAKIQELAKPRCRHCYGRGYQGRIFPTGELILCACVMKNSDKKAREAKKAENAEVHQ